MVWRRVKRSLGWGIVLVLVGCGREGEMPEQVEMPDTMEVMRAMQDPRRPGRHARYHARRRDGPRRLDRRDATPGFQEVMFGLSLSYDGRSDA